MTFIETQEYAFELLNDLHDNYQAEDVNGEIAQHIQFAQTVEQLSVIVRDLGAAILMSLKARVECVR